MGSHYIAQACLKLKTLQPQPPECWDCRCGHSAQLAEMTSVIMRLAPGLELGGLMQPLAWYLRFLRGNLALVDGTRPWGPCGAQRWTVSPVTARVHTTGNQIGSQGRGLAHQSKVEHSTCPPAEQEAEAS
jgi:hypothetical protein